MAHKVIMPKQGLQMTEGTIISWLVKEGGDCVQGQPLFEMETDKLSIEIETQESGKLLKIVRGEGETVPITELIAVIGEAGEDISSLFEDEKTHTPEAIRETEKQTLNVPSVAVILPADGDKIYITPRARELAQSRGVDFSKVPGTGPDGLIIERDIINNLESSLNATPLARKIAGQHDVPLGDVSGTGARGKIVSADVMARFDAHTGSGARTGRVVPFAGMRKVIADRMVESLRTAAQLTHKMSVDMSEATRLRESLKKADKKVSFNDIISFAVCRALIEHPIMNSELTEDGILLKDYVNLGIAVALEDGLIVPVIRDADLMTLGELSAMTYGMADKAKNGKLKPDEYKGGSFTISNLGMFGLDSFTAIINQPESGILAVGVIEKKPVVRNDEITIRPMMELTLSYDHRVADGAPAAEFLAKVKRYLEQPYILL
jgi:pyruvate dehydrogenase E2 component (dihydrolipoamide acetyltransferase)